MRYQKFLSIVGVSACMAMFLTVMGGNTGASNGTNTAPGDPQFCNNAAQRTTILNDAGFPIPVPSFQILSNLVNLAVDAGSWSCDGGHFCDGGAASGNNYGDALPQRVSVNICNTAENGGSGLIKCCESSLVLYPDAGIVDAGEIIGDAGPVLQDAGILLQTIFDAGYPYTAFDAGPCYIQSDAGFVDGGPYTYGYAFPPQGMGATPYFQLVVANQTSNFVNLALDAGNWACDGGNVACDGGPTLLENIYTGDAGPSCLIDGGPVSFVYDAGVQIINACGANGGQGCTTTYVIGILDGGPLYWDGGYACPNGGPTLGVGNPGDAIGVGFCLKYNAGFENPILCVPQQVNAAATSTECNSN